MADGGLITRRALRLNSGGELPENPGVSDVYIKTGDDAGLYLCLVDGSWVGPAKLATPVTEVFITPGAGTWTCPAGVTSVRVQGWAGGGNGSNGGKGQAGVGGRGGAWGTSVLAVVPETVYDFFVGDAEEDTWFIDTTTFKIINGSAGGEALACVADFARDGGVAGFFVFAGGGSAGGGGAGTNAPGGNGEDSQSDRDAIGGVGGAVDGGDGGNGSFADSGTAGEPFGGGGGGGSKFGLGGAGAAGKLILSYVV